MTKNKLFISSICQELEEDSFFEELSDLDEGLGEYLEEDSDPEKEEEEDDEEEEEDWGKDIE